MELLLVLSTSSDDDLSWLRAGEATSAVLLEAATGLSTCTLSQPLEVVETGELVRDEVLGSAACPQLVIRVGWAAFNADPLPATPPSRHRPPQRPGAEVSTYIRDFTTLGKTDTSVAGG